MDSLAEGRAAVSLGQLFYLPAFAVELLHVVVGFLRIREAEIGGIPGELFTGEAAGDGAEQNGFGERAGVVEVGSGFAFTADGISPLEVVVDLFQLRNRGGLIFFLRQQLGEAAVAAEEDAFF